MLRRQSFFEADAWSEPEIAAGERRIGVSVSHVALLICFALNGDGAAGDARNELQHMIERDARSTTNIVHVARLPLVPGGDRSHDGIGDEREITRLFSVAVQSNCLTLLDGCEKTMKSHVGPLPGAVDREIPQGNRGNAVVEMALVLPIMLLLVFGITEFGRAWMTVNILQTASREGARLAVVTTPDVSAVQARATAVCRAAAITPTSVDCVGPDIDGIVTVTVNANFNVVSGHVLNMFSGTIPLSAQTSMRSENGS